MQKRCNHPNHEGPRYLPVASFHKQGRRHGKQQYRSTCKVCANREYRAKYAEGKRKNGWQDERQAYSRARSRAVTRLLHMYPGIYEILINEELQKEPGWHGGKYVMQRKVEQ